MKKQKSVMTAYILFPLGLHRFYLYGFSNCFFYIITVCYFGFGFWYDVITLTNQVKKVNGSGDENDFNRTEKSQSSKEKQILKNNNLFFVKMFFEKILINQNNEIPFFKKLQFTGTSPLKYALGMLLFVVSILCSILFIFFRNSQLTLDDRLDQFESLISINEFDKAEKLAIDIYSDDSFDNTLRITSGTANIYIKRSDWKSLYGFITAIKPPQSIKRQSKLRLIQLYLDTARYLFLAKDYKNASSVYRQLLLLFIYVPPISELNYEQYFKDFIINENNSFDYRLKLKLANITMPSFVTDLRYTLKDKEMKKYDLAREKAGRELNKLSNEEKRILIEELLVGLKMNPLKYSEAINSICLINEIEPTSDNLKFNNLLTLSDICRNENLRIIDGKDFLEKYGILFLLDKKVDEKNVSCLKQRPDQERIYIVDKLSCNKNVKEKYLFDLLVKSNGNYYTLNTNAYSFE